jgi:hypothetical protein
MVDVHGSMVTKLCHAHSNVDGIDPMLEYTSTSDVDICV